MSQDRHLRYGVSEVADELIRRLGIRQTEIKIGDSRHTALLEHPDGKKVQLESLKRMVRRHLKDEYHKEDYSLNEAEFVYLLFTDFDFKIKVLKLFGLGDEILKAEQDRDRAKRTLADQRRHFESNAPAEWLAAIRELEGQLSIEQIDAHNAARDASYAKESPEARRERENWELEHEKEVVQLNSPSESEELSLMIRAIFYNTVGRAFNIEKFRNDFAERRRLRGMMQYPGDGPEWEVLAEQYNELAHKVDVTLAGRDLSAYTDSREDRSNG